MKKALIFGFLATSLTVMALAQNAQAEMKNFGIPEKHVCTPEEIDLVVRTVGVIERNCSPESIRVMEELAFQLGTCDLGETAPNWLMKIGKVGAAAIAYKTKCAVQKAAAERQAAAEQRRMQQEQQAQPSTEQ